MCDKGDCPAKDGYQPNKASGIDEPGAFQVLEVSALDALEHQIWLCEECLFYNPAGRDNINIGDCRVNAPIFTKNAFRGLWPAVYFKDWCGESKPNAEILAKMREDEIRWGIEAAKKLVAAVNAAQKSPVSDDPNEDNTTL